MERDTRQRAAIRSAIERAQRPLSPPEILSMAQAEVPQMSLATVYRNLKAMQEDGAIASVWLPGESARYEATHLAHHHHFRCNRCEQVFDIHGCAGDALHVAPAGFVVERHELTLYGLCAGCTSQKSKVERVGATHTPKTSRVLPAHTHTHAHTHGDAHSHAKTRTQRDEIRDKALARSVTKKREK
jgi:Fur family transcriptional regulator, ferric uptake regulator